MFIIIRDWGDCIRNLMFAEKEGKTTLTFLKNTLTNVILEQTWLEHFEKHTINKQKINMVNEFMVNEFIVNEQIILVKCLLIINDLLLTCLLSVFNLTKIIVFSSFSCLHASYPLQLLNFDNFESLGIVYCLEVDKWQQTRNTNIN